MAGFKDPEAMSPAERWTIALTMLMGSFMAVMDTSVVNVALPHMIGSFGQDLSSITWVATAYTIAEIIMVTMSGWWCTLIGRKKLLLVSFTLFTIGSILCGTATTFTQMIIYRVIQGIGGGSLIPLSQAILRETFPLDQQGMAMSIFGMGVVLAPALGPTFGGWLTDTYGWPWIFYINIPICIIGILLIARFIFDPDYLRRGVKSIDGLGIALLAVSLTTMQIVLERGQDKNWFESTQIRVFTAITVLSFLALIIWELRCKEPIVNLRILKDKNLALGAVIGLIFGVSLFGTTFILPQFTQQLLGYPAFQSGLVLAPRSITLLLFMPVSGWMFQKVGARPLLFFGIAMISISYYGLARLSIQAGFWNLMPTLVIMGIGMPFMFVPLSTVSLSTTKRENMTDASALYTLSRRIGGNLGYALAATLLNRGITAHRMYLASHISSFSQTTQAYQASLADMLRDLGLNAVAASHLSIAMMEKELVRQATMLAYNDVSVVFGCLFLGLLPFIFLIPGREAIMEVLSRKKRS